MEAGVPAAKAAGKQKLRNRGVSARKKKNRRQPLPTRAGKRRATMVAQASNGEGGRVGTMTRQKAGGG